MKTTNKNFLYNIIYQVFVFIIPLITTPYISRVLGADKIGIYSYTYSLVYYFMLAAMLGINNYGSREIAKLSSNKILLSKKFLSIYFLQIIFTIVMIVLFFIFYFTFKYDYKNILLIQFLYVFSCGFDINWFFFGLEKFKVTISRNIIIKICSLIFVFLFIKNNNDLWKYTLILALSTLISQMYLWIFIKKEIILIKVSFKDIFSNLKSCVILFIPVIAYSIYRVMDKTMIGYFADTIQLGNYESAEKIINIPLSIITSLGTVMMPHMAKIKEFEFDSKIKSTYKLCFFMILPIIFGLLTICDDFCFLFFGSEFVLTPNIIKLLLITVLFSCITNITRNNYLIPKSLDDVYVKSTIFGAIVNFILNFILIKRFGVYGACIGTIAAEFTVMVYQVFLTKDHINYLENLKSIFPFVINSLIMGVIIYFMGMYIIGIYLKIILQIIVGAITYAILNHNYIINEFLSLNRKTSILK